MSKQFWAALLIIAAILGGIVFVTNHNKPSTTGAAGQPTNHVEGTSPEGVKLVEYGDFQCPVCAEFYAVTKQIAQTYSDRIVFQFRNLPLTSIHQNAFAAARAAEAAGMQNKYWEMHDLIYQNQSSWSQSSNPLAFFESYATSLGLNKTKFDQDYASDAVNKSINADLAEFAKIGDDMATPTYYLDGKKLQNLELVDKNGSPSADAFAKLIDAELAKKATH